MRDFAAVIFGIPIDACTMDDAIDRVDELIRLGRKYGRAHQVATVNVDFLVNATAQPDVHRLLQRADLNLADGMPVVWAGRLFGTPLPQRVAGADLVTQLAETSAARGWKVHFFGAGPGVADRARSLMLERSPGANITADSGPESIDVSVLDVRIADSITAVDPDVLCVALGNPKQERFIATYREAVGCPVMIGVGGSLDMMVGVRRRAPRWMQRSGTEWVFRAAQEPGRLGRRYAHDIRVFGPALTRYWRATRRFRSAALCEPTCARSLERRWDDETSVEQAGVQLDLSGFDRLDRRAHASVIGVLRDSRLKGVPVAVVGVNRSLQTCLEAYETWPLVAEHLG